MSLYILEPKSDKQIYYALPIIIYLDVEGLTHILRVTFLLLMTLHICMRVSGPLHYY